MWCYSAPFSLPLSVFIFLPFLSSFSASVLPSLFTSCSSLHPCFTCFLHFFLSFFLKSFWPILLLYFLHSYFLFPLSSGSSSVFPSLLISFHVPLSFLFLFLLSFVLLSFLLYLNLTSSFFLVFYIYSHRASDLVWSVGLILCVSSETFTFYWSMTVAAIFVFHSSFQPRGREALLNLISFGMTLIMQPGNLR